MLSSLLLGACQSSSSQPPSPQPAPPPIEQPVETPALVEPEPVYDGTVRVGLLLPLSGRHAAIGQALLNAAEMALFQAAGENFALEVHDTGGTPEGAGAAARSALDAGAGLILGPLFSTSVAAVTQEAQLAGVSVITFSNNVEVAGPSTFVMGVTPQSQVDRVVDYAYALGSQRFAALVPESAYGRNVVTALQQAVGRNGAQLGRVVFYDPAAADKTPQVESLAEYGQRKAALKSLRAQLAAKGDAESLARLQALKGRDTAGGPDFDALLLPAGGRELMGLAPLLSYFDIDPGDVRYLGTALWDNPRLAREANLRGGWFAAPARSSWESFKRQYQAAYGANPPRVVSLAYDAVALAAVSARSGEQSGFAVDYSPASLTQPSGFSGIDGVFRFRPDGTIQRSLAVMELQQNGVQEIEPALGGFQDLIN